MKKRFSKELVAASAPDGPVHPGGRRELRLRDPQAGQSGGELEWSDMLYPVLHRLERDGMIAGRWELTEEGRRRKYYRLTRRGKRQLATDREAWRTVHGALEVSWGGSNV